MSFLMVVRSRLFSASCVCCSSIILIRMELLFWRVEISLAKRISLAFSGVHPKSCMISAIRERRQCMCFSTVAFGVSAEKCGIRGRLSTDGWTGVCHGAGSLADRFWKAFCQASLVWLDWVGCALPTFSGSNWIPPLSSLSLEVLSGLKKLVRILRFGGSSSSSDPEVTDCCGDVPLM